MKKRAASLEGLLSSHFRQSQQRVSFARRQDSVQKTLCYSKVASQSSYPFKPEVHQLPFELYPRHQTEVSRDMVMERLIEDKRKKEDKHRAYRLNQQEKQYRSTCTFQPQINRNSVELVKKNQVARLPLLERLYTEGVSKLKSIDVINLFNDKENCPFQPNAEKPKILLHHDVQFITPIYKRIEQIVREKRELLKNLQQERDKDTAGPRFVNQKTEQILKHKQDFKKNVLERLSVYMRNTKASNQRKVDLQKEEESKKCTFQPAISPCADLVVREGDFVKRQETLAREMRNRLQQKINETKQTFQPQINRLSHLLINSEREGETVEEQVDRLNYQPLIQKQLQIQQIEREIYRECSFHPKINQLSKALTATPTVHCCKGQKVQQEFKLAINPQSKLIMERKAKLPPKPVSEDPKEKLRKQLEYGLMEECTFHPKTNVRKKQGSQRSLSEVQGIEQFMHKCEALKARKKEEELHREKVFNLEKKYKPRVHTVIEQFKLTEPELKESKLREEAERRFSAECTFRPKITRLR